MIEPKQNNLVSIIIPVYNVEQYLDKSIQSAVNQTYEYIEIILVDDGSKDKSGHMCDKWAYGRSNIIVIHKTNGGLSSARNIALDICKGNYLFFLDGDDYLAEDTIEVMMTDALRSDADIVETSFYHVYSNKIICRNKEKEAKTINTVEAIQYDLGARGGGGQFLRVQSYLNVAFLINIVSWTAN